MKTSHVEKQKIKLNCGTKVKRLNMYKLITSAEFFIKALELSWAQGNHTPSCIFSSITRNNPASVCVCACVCMYVCNLACTTSHLQVGTLPLECLDETFACPDTYTASSEHPQCSQNEEVTFPYAAGSRYTYLISLPFLSEGRVDSGSFPPFFRLRKGRETSVMGWYLNIC